MGEDVGLDRLDSSPHNNHAEPLGGAPSRPGGLIGHGSGYDFIDDDSRFFIK